MATVYHSRVMIYTVKGRTLSGQPLQLQLKFSPLYD